MLVRATQGLPQPARVRLQQVHAAYAQRDTTGWRLRLTSADVSPAQRAIPHQRRGRLQLVRAECVPLAIAGMRAVVPIQADARHARKAPTRAHPATRRALHALPAMPQQGQGRLQRVRAVCVQRDMAAMQAAVPTRADVPPVLWEPTRNRQGTLCALPAL